MMTIPSHGRQSMRLQDWSLGSKVALVFAIYSVVMLLGITTVAYLDGLNRARELASERVHGLALAAEGYVHEYVNGIAQDTLTQTLSPAMLAYRDAILTGDAEAIAGAKAALEAHLTVHAQTRPYVYQARVLDAASGRELVRVVRDTRFGDLRSAALQDKGHREYVAEMRRLKPGQLYVSAVTLNREHGVIEQPHRPTQRFGRLIHDEDGDPVLMLVLNVGFRHLVFRLQRLYGESTELMVFDEAGYVLAHPNTDLEFDFETGPGTKAVDLFGPEAALFGQQWSSNSGNTLTVETEDRLVGLRRIRLSPLARQDLIIGAAQDPAHYVASLTSIGERSWMLAVGFLAVGSLMFGVVGSILVRPVNHMLAQIDAYEPGGGGAKPGRRMLDRRDEFGTLARAVYGLALRTEAQMRSAKGARDEMESMFQTAADAIVFVDEDGLIEDVNTAAETLFGWTRAELLGRRASILLVPEDPTLTLGREREDGSPLQLVAGRSSEAVRRDGSHVPVVLAISEVGTGRGRRFVVIIHDASHVFALEAARSASLAKTRFLANMSHELRTPLNAVVLHAEMIADEAQDVGNAQMIEDSTNIKDAARHLLDLINGILDLARIEAGRTELSLEPIDLELFVSEIRSMAQALAVAKGNTVRIETWGLPATITADRVKLRQCLLNLISNAAKFTEKGIITVEVSHRPDRLNMAVTDTGIGMTDEQMTRVFDLFEQANSYIHGQFGGSGIGLALTRSIMDLMGGTVMVESEVGKGTRFSLSVPLAVDEAEQEDQPHTVVAAGSTLALIVDSNSERRIARMTSLADVGLRVVGAASVRDAIERVVLHGPDMLLVDASETVDGAVSGLRQALLAEPATAAVPILFLSEGAEPDTLQITGPCGRLRTLRIDAAVAGAMTGCLGCGVDRTVMVVEDDAGMLRAIARAVEREGLPAVVFGNGDDVLVHLRHHAPAAVLLDLSLPGANGFEIIKALKASPRTAAVPVFVVTGIDLTVAESVWLAEQADAVVRKADMDFEALMALVVSTVSAASKSCALDTLALSGAPHQDALGTGGADDAAIGHRRAVAE
ncbi:ATP-binding protein [Roseospira visakhapatnamensis]|uniref:histidine kinase n=1 Tax=Roseospira visakhapatnamensis TaxID=390880 RepID=A0A7W6RC81_9PROT|nr:ATP-binding protein [Roseospira visakhapatnamensis]MBB4265840.1 PAS domain S-box-containing protein [Roseospira visakhapatnamensis]